MTEVMIVEGNPNGLKERGERLRRLMEVPKFPLWLKIVACALGFLFIYLFVTWAIWAMQTVVVPRVQGRSPGAVTQPAHSP